MSLGRSWQRRWLFAMAGSSLAIAACGAGRLWGRLQRRGRSLPAASALPREPSSSPDPAGLLLPGRESDGVLAAQRKRIMGRLHSLEMVRRTALEIRPLVDRALRQPGTQPDLNALALRAQMPVDQYRSYFADKEEGDLLLESGGEPTARSAADAVGVAQFLAGTGRECGLRIDLVASRGLSQKIAAVDQQIAWLQVQPPEWSRHIPDALLGVLPTTPPRGVIRPDASQIPAPVLPTPNPDPHRWGRDQWMAYRLLQRANLAASRRRVDERYNSGKAIIAQSRYLLRLSRRYGGVDWALQAYHGGEAGAAHTMSLFASAGSRTLLASRASGEGCRWLPYSELYHRISPTGTPAAFSYLFGRSDDHRYYWWKVLMAERALTLYRRDPAEFEREWQELKPGESMDAAWYPEPASLQFSDAAALRAAYHDHRLVPFPRSAPALGVHTAGIASLEPESAPLQKGLRPEAMGTLLRLAQLYRNSGGKPPLVAVSLVESQEYRRRSAAHYPSPPPAPGVPVDPDYHSTGLVFDLRRPERDWDRKVLEYALGRLYDNLRISWHPEDDAGGQRYRVVVNPAYRQEAIAFLHRLAH